MMTKIEYYENFTSSKAIDYEQHKRLVGLWDGGLTLHGISKKEKLSINAVKRHLKSEGLYGQ